MGDEVQFVLRNAERMEIAGFMAPDGKRFDGWMVDKVIRQPKVWKNRL